MPKVRVVFVAGRAGSGKGTHCSKLSEEFGFHHINVGELLRNEKDNHENQDQEVIASCMNAGNIVPAAITCRLLEKKLGEIVQSSNGKNPLFLLDGFPRDVANVEAWDDTLAENYDLKFMLVLNCSEKTCFERLLNRGKTSGRGDDNDEGIRKRLPDHVTFTEPAIRHFRSLGLLKEVNSEKNLVEVYEDVKKIFLGFL